MQYVLIAYDGDDEQALARRMAFRDAHIELSDKMRIEGKILYGAAILDDKEKMIGSILICDFSSENELHEWLQIEPYVAGKVWKTIEIKKCRVGPSFLVTGEIAR